MSTSQTIRKVVFPAAGLGTRILPATVVLPKELLPILDKPIIQYGVEEALEALQFLPSPAAAQLAKVVKSAAANAENQLYLSRSDLKIVEIFANEGPSLKRFRARARGRAARIIKRNSHVTVVVDEEEL